MILCFLMVLGASRGTYSAETGGGTGAPVQEEPAKSPENAPKNGGKVPPGAQKKQIAPKGSEPLGGQQKKVLPDQKSQQKQELRKDAPQPKGDIAGKKGGPAPVPAEKKKLLPEEKKTSPKEPQKKDLPREQLNRPGVPEPRLENIIPGIGKKAETLKDKEAPKDKKGELRPPEGKKDPRRETGKKKKTVPRETRPPRDEPKDIRREITEEKKEPEKKDEQEKEIVPVVQPPFYSVYSFGEAADREFARDWMKTLTSKEIANWCRSRSMVPVPDAKPVVNNKASFVSRYGSVISVKGLQRHRRYRAWIDFVRYRGNGDCGVSARLEIYGDRKLLKSFRYKDLQEMRKPFVLSIPYEVTHDGAVELKFREYSDTGGFWGVWDVVVSDQYELPETLSGSGADKAGAEMKIRDPLIEEKKELRPEKIKAK
jgi:hypothetical protein